MVLGKPWTWIENASDPIDPKQIDPMHKNLGLVGYCIDLVKEFSERIGFDYELVISDGLGRKDMDGMWTGKRLHHKCGQDRKQKKLSRGVGDKSDPYY